MPNWAHNKLTVTGDPDDVEALVTAVVADDHGDEFEVEWSDETQRVNQPLDFTKIVPEPDHEAEQEVDTAAEANGDVVVKAAIRAVFPDWYSWRLEHWGTKWNANFTGEVIAFGREGMKIPEDGRTPIIEPGKAFYAFETAWSPPEPIVIALSEQHPELEVELIWGEVGSETAGRYKAVNGVMVEDVELDIEEALTPEEFWF